MGYLRVNSLFPTLWETNNHDMKTICTWTAREQGGCTGLTNTLEDSTIQGEAQGEFGGHQSPPTDGAAWTATVPPSSEFSDSEVLGASREGGIPAEAGKDSSISSPAMRDQSWAPPPCVADGGSFVARRDCVHSATPAAASTAAAAGGRGERRCWCKQVCTFRDKSHGRQPCATYLGFVWWGKTTWHNSRVHSAAGN